MAAHCMQPSSAVWYFDCCLYVNCTTSFVIHTSSPVQTSCAVALQRTRGTPCSLSSGAHEREVWSQGMAQEVLNEGYRRRQSAAMASNRCSSRSHCLVCITVNAAWQVRCPEKATSATCVHPGPSLNAVAFLGLSFGSPMRWSAN
jgi:hypothetical protein